MIDNNLPISTAIPPANSVQVPISNVSQAPLPPIATTPPPPPKPFLRKKLLLLIVLLAVIVPLLIGFGYLFYDTYIFNGITKLPDGSLNINPDKIGRRSFFPIIEDLSKYNKDSDSDGYPDFIETAIGFNPNESEEVRCRAGKDCADAGLVNTNIKNNVMIILDASGSMGSSINGQIKMTAALSAIKSYVENAENNNINVGLIIYGHKGSNSAADKAISCGSVETLAPIGTLTSQGFDAIASQIKPVGWTPLGTAIRKATGEMKTGAENTNEVILVTDGGETCDSDPESAARDAYNSPAKIKVNIIGFAVSLSEESTLTRIAISGHGSFSAASSADMLAQKMDALYNDLYENSKKLNAEVRCKSDIAAETTKCVTDASTKVQEYLTTLIGKAYKKQISNAEYKLADALSEKLFSQTLDRIRQKDVDTENAIQKLRDLKLSK